MITDTERAYICGWMDADGCFSIYKQNRKGMKIGFDLTPSLKIANNDRKVVLWIINKMGIPITNKKPYARKLPSGKISWMVDITKYEQLYRILPSLTFLITKKEEAEILYKFVQRRLQRWKLFREARSNGIPSKICHKKYPLFTKQDIQDYEEMKEMKKRR